MIEKLGIWVAGAAILLGASATEAVTWYLEDVTFEDGSQAVGSFDFDEATNTFSMIDISKTEGTTYPAAVFTTFGFNSGASALFITPSFPAVTGEQQMALVFSSDLTDAGGTVSLQPVNNTSQIGTCRAVFDDRCSSSTTPFVALASGQVATVAPIPIPASLGLLMVAVAGLGAVAARRTGRA